MFGVDSARFYGAGCRSLAPDDMREKNSANYDFRGMSGSSNLRARRIIDLSVRAPGVSTYRLLCHVNLSRSIRDKFGIETLTSCRGNATRSAQALEHVEIRDLSEAPDSGQ